MPEKASEDKDDSTDEEIGDVVNDLPTERQGARPKSSSTGVFKITGPSKYANPAPASKPFPQDVDDPDKPRRQ